MSFSDDMTLNSSQSFGLIPSYSDQFIAKKPAAFANSLGITSFGVRFKLSTDQEELLRDALLYLPLECKRSFSVSGCPHYALVRGGKFSNEGKPAYRLYRNGRQLSACRDRRELLERFRSILSLHVAEESTTRTFIHAGVVGWGNRAILIPGRSFSGKTTLVAELVRAGAIYYSDEFAVVDKRGMVYPYAQPLQVRESGSHRQTQRPVEEFGGVAGNKPLQVGLVIVSRYKPEAHWGPRQLTPGVGLLKLLDNTVSARRAPAVALSTLKQVVSNAVIVRGVRGEASQLVNWITANCVSPQACNGPNQ